MQLSSRETTGVRLSIEDPRMWPLAPTSVSASPDDPYLTPPAVDDGCQV
jgi:hypothetical protein